MATDEATGGTTKPPQGLGRRARALWGAVTAALDLDERDLALLGEACRVSSRLDELDAILRREGAMCEGKIHPALVEARQQEIAFARLIVAMRLPEDLSLPSHGRPQRRGTRGFYHPRHGRSDEA